MEAAAASVPITIGIHALKVLNGWLANKEIAMAWYGQDVDDFTRTKLSFKKLRRIVTFSSPVVEKAFAVHQHQWPELIRKCLEKSHTWYGRRYDGECCWLPLYRAIKQNNQKNKHEKVDFDSVLKPANSNPSFVATMASRPAAHLATWGLVVLSYASGGSPRFHEFNGGYSATFDTRFFVLVIKRDNLVSPTIAHLTPTDPKPNMPDHLSEHEWKKLLDTGCSVDQSDELFRWFKDAICPEDIVEAPDELVDGKMDRKIKRLIIDESHANELKKGLVDTLYGCHHEWQKRNGGNLLNLPLRPLPLKGHGEKISQNLLKAKVLSVDEVRNDFCQEMSSNDVLRYAENQLKLVKDAVKVDPELQNILSLHKRIVAYQKLLSLSLRIPAQLSTRDTGDSLILAGS